MCTGCWYGTSGPCQAANTACYGYIAGTTCPWGTTACGPLSTASLLAVGVAAEDVVVVRMQLHGISRAGFTQPLRSTFKAQIAATAHVLPAAVDLRYVADVRDAASQDGALVVLASIDGDASQLAVDVQVAITVPTEDQVRLGQASAANVAASLSAAIDDGSLAAALAQAGVGVASTSRDRDVQIVDRASFEAALRAASGQGGQGGGKGPGGFLGVDTVVAVSVVVAALAASVAAVCLCRMRRGGGKAVSKVRMIMLPEGRALAGAGTPAGDATRPAETPTTAGDPSPAGCLRPNPRRLERDSHAVTPARSSINSPNSKRAPRATHARLDSMHSLPGSIEH